MDADAVPEQQPSPLRNGPERSVLKREVSRLGLVHTVHFLGFVPHSRVPAVLAHADLLVLPSLYEELGTVLLEAMAASIVFEDGRLLAISKPSGVASHGGSGIGFGVIETLRALRPRESLELVHDLVRQAPD